MASIRRIDEVLDEPIDLSDENASQKDRKVEKGRVEFKDVSFPTAKAVSRFYPTSA